MKDYIHNLLRILDGIKRNFSGFQSENQSHSPRLRIIQAILYGWILLVICRLAQLQIFMHSDLSRLAKNQQIATQPIIAKRGKIIDRNGFSLAESIETSSLATTRVVCVEQVGITQILKRSCTITHKTSFRYLFSSGKV